MPDSAADSDADGKSALQLGFKVFKLAGSNFPRTEFQPAVDKSDEENLAALAEYIKEKEKQQTFDFSLDDLLTEILIKQGFNLNFKYQQAPEFEKNKVFDASDGKKQALICLDSDIKLETIEDLKAKKDQKFVCLERALDTTKKWNLNNILSEKFCAI